MASRSSTRFRAPASPWCSSTVRSSPTRSGRWRPSPVWPVGTGSSPITVVATQAAAATLAPSVSRGRRLTAGACCGTSAWRGHTSSATPSAAASLSSSRWTPRRSSTRWPYWSRLCSSARAPSRTGRRSCGASSATARWGRRSSWTRPCGRAGRTTVPPSTGYCRGPLSRRWPTRRPSSSWTSGSWTGSSARRRRGASPSQPSSCSAARARRASPLQRDVPAAARLAAGRRRVRPARRDALPAG